MNNINKIFHNGPVPELDRNYYFWRGTNLSDKRLFIIFSSVGAYPGNFSFFRTFETLNVNVLHITPPDFSWYQNGLNGISDNIETSFVELSSLIESFCHDVGICEIYITGASMGGYAAMVYASLSKKSINLTVISFGTETILKLKDSKSRQFNFDIKKGYRDIRNLNYSGINVNMIFGEFDMVDSYSALTMSYRKNFNLYSCQASGHAVPEYFNKKIGIVNFFKSFLNGGKSFIGRGHMPSELDEFDLIELINNDQLSSLYVEALYKCIKKYPAFGYGLNRLGAYLHMKGDLKEAKNALEQSLLINPDYQNSLEHLINIKRKLAQT